MAAGLSITTITVTKRPERFLLLALSYLLFGSCWVLSVGFSISSPLF